MKVLISAPYFIPIIKRFQSEFDRRNIEVIIPQVNERLEESDLLKLMPDIDGIICGDDRFTPKAIEISKKLKVISKWGTGIDSINKEACQKRGIKICNTPNAFSIPVADTVLGYALNFCRNISRMDTEMKNGIWDKIPGFALSEATFGIIGVGNIGSAVAKRVHSFGAKILGCDLKEISKDLINETKIKQVPLEALLKECDIISLNTDLNPSSEHLINKKTLELMKPSAYLINTSRGPVVNETDLIDALKNKKLAGAGLDVFEHEPLPKNSELLKMKNVFIAPHNSNSSPRAWENVHLNTLNNLFRELGVL